MTTAASAKPLSTSPSLNWKCLATLEASPVGLPSDSVTRSSCSSGASVCHGLSRRRVTRRQRLVVDVDQRQRLLGDVRVDGGDGGDGVALVEHLVAGQAVAAQVAQVDGPLAQLGDLVAGVGKIGGGDDRLDAGQRQGLADVDVPDAAHGHGAAQDAAVQQAGHLHVGPVERPGR